MKKIKCKECGNEIEIDEEMLCFRKIREIEKERDLALIECEVLKMQNELDRIKYEFEARKEEYETKSSNIAFLIEKEKERMELVKKSPFFKKEENK